MHIVWMLPLYLCIALPGLVSASEKFGRVKCEEITLRRSLSSPPPIRFDREAQARPEELAIAGEFFTPVLEDGIHVFLILANRTIIVSRSIPDYDVHFLQSPFMATHRSLHGKVRQLGMRANLRALGEIIVKNGRVSVITNRARILSGNSRNLRFAADVLWLAGLKVEENTILQDWARPQRRLINEDSEDIVAARRELEYFRTPMFSQLRTLGRRLAERFPSDEVPGEIDVTRFIEWATLHTDAGTIAKAPALSEAAVLLAELRLPTTGRLNTLYNYQRLARDLNREGIGFVARLLGDPGFAVHKLSLPMTESLLERID